MGSEPIKITLPLPPKELHPNARCHWRAKLGPKRRCRDDAELVAMSEGLSIQGKVVMHAHWYFDQRRLNRHDDDNLTAWLKPSRDGIARAAGIDDKMIRMGRHEQDKDPENPRVEVVIEPVESIQPRGK